MNHDYKATRCRICEREIVEFGQLNRVPIIDPYASKYSNDLASLVGAPVHIDCWAQHSLWREVARLAMTDFRLMFRDGRTLLDSDYAGAWIKRAGGPSYAIGALFLPRSAYVYANMLGDDVKGGFASGSANDVLTLVKFICEVKSSGCIRSAQQAFPTVSVEHVSYGKSVILGFSDPERIRVNLYLADVDLLDVLGGTVTLTG